MSQSETYSNVRGGGGVAVSVAGIGSMPIAIGSPESGSDIVELPAAVTLGPILSYFGPSFTCGDSGNLRTRGKVA